MQFVVTLPAVADSAAFAASALRAGADLLEVRNDISPSPLDIETLMTINPLLVSRRTTEFLPARWIECAAFVDQDISLPPQRLNLSVERIILSFHSSVRMNVEDAFELWKDHCRNGEGIKYIELFADDSEERLKRIRQKLRTLSNCVTVLPMGEGSTELRRELAKENALHYCALSEQYASAPGQALVAEERKYLKLRMNSTAGAGII